VRRWQKNADAHLLLAKYKPPNFAGAVQVTISWSAAGYGKHDADNFLKACLDYGSRIQLWEDDSQIYTLHVSFDPDVPRGYCRVSVRPLEHPTPEPKVPTLSSRKAALSAQPVRRRYTKTTAPA
jgi:Holliday junction resolvase RusA-like endonuclease